MKTKRIVENISMTEPIEADQFSPEEDVVALVAYELWRQRGRPIGSPEEDWFRAENEIKHNRTPGSVA